MLKSFITLTIVLAFGSAYAQVFSRKIETDGPPVSGKLACRALEEATSKAAVVLLGTYLEALVEDGYLEAACNLDTAEDGDTVISLIKGNKYVVDSILVNGLTSTVDFAEDQKRYGLAAGRPFSWKSVERYIEGLISYHNNAGYPFAAAGSPDVKYSPRAPGIIGVKLVYKFLSGPLVVWSLPATKKDTLRESKRFLASHLSIQVGAPFSARLVKEVPLVLGTSPYYKLIGSPSAVISGDSAKLILDLRRRKTNRFDAIIGLLPPKGTQDGWLLTAFVDLRLVSALKLGEVLDLKYEQLPSTSRRLNLSYRQPNLAGSQLSFSLNLNLYKQDSSFQNLTFEPHLAYAFTPFLSARFFSQIRSSGLLNVKPYSEIVWPPPPVLDSKSTFTGIGILYERIDDRINPTKGITVDIQFGVGQKTIKRTVGLDSLDFDRLLLLQPKQELRFDMSFFKPLGKQQVLVLKGKTYWLGQTEYFDNDLAQLGGARSLRGFNENEFLTNFYSFATIEYRLLLTQTSYLGCFLDYGFVQTKSFSSKREQWPLGSGLALQVQTKAGNVLVSYAIGRTSGLSFQPARGRIHIGYAANF